MQLREIQELLSATVLCGEEHLDFEVQSACGSDFMSDVLAYVKNQALLMTGLVNPHVVRTADMLDMRCIIFIRNKTPDASILELARDRGIVIMSSPERMYNACGILYTNGLRGG